MKVKFKDWNCVIEWSIYLENDNIAIKLLDEKTKELVEVATTNTSEETDWEKYKSKIGLKIVACGKRWWILA